MVLDTSIHVSSPPPALAFTSWPWTHCSGGSMAISRGLVIGIVRSISGQRMQSSSSHLETLKKIPADWLSNGVLYNVGNPLPYARPCNDCVFLGKQWTDVNSCIGNRDLTIGYRSTTNYQLRSTNSVALAEARAQGGTGCTAMTMVIST